MKKTISVLLILVMSIAMLTFTACGTTQKDENTTGGVVSDSTPSIASPVDFLTDVWNAFGEENQFACAGGDTDHAVEGPGVYQLNAENAESFQYLLHVTPELYEMLDGEGATLMHMMNGNTFTSAVARLKDPSKASDFAESYKNAIQAQQWMCGFPDKVVVISVGDCVVMAYGHEGNIDNLVSACSAVEEQSVLLVDAPAFVE